MDRLLRAIGVKREPRSIPGPMAYYRLDVPLEGIDYFMLEVDGDGTPRRELGFRAAGEVIHAAADDHPQDVRCIWHASFGWEIEPILEDAELLKCTEFEEAWARR